MYENCWSSSDPTLRCQIKLEPDCFHFFRSLKFSMNIPNSFNDAIIAFITPQPTDTSISMAILRFTEAMAFNELTRTPTNIKTNSWQVFLVLTPNHNHVLCLKTLLQFCNSFPNVLANEGSKPRTALTADIFLSDFHLLSHEKLPIVQKAIFQWKCKNSNGSRLDKRCEGQQKMSDGQ